MIVPVTVTVEAEDQADAEAIIAAALSTDPRITNAIAQFPTETTITVVDHRPILTP